MGGLLRLLLPLLRDSKGAPPRRILLHNSSLHISYDLMLEFLYIYKELLVQNDFAF